MMNDAPTLRQQLWHRSRDAAPELVVEGPSGTLQCLACGHRCRIGEGREGICRVRFRDGGPVRVPWGWVAGVQVDPIEKKPFFHVLPGSEALSFGMLGCDLHCSYCQNWITSQALRDPAAQAPIRETDAASLVEAARRGGARTLVSTYNEPLITAEWAHHVFEAGQEAGLLCGFVSNGNATPEVLDYLRPVTDLFKVDLKSFEDRRYRELGGVLARVCDSLEELLARDFWVEVVTLVVPGFNDSEKELAAMADFLAGLSADLPWHVTGFVPQYKMDEVPATPASTLARAREIGLAAGLRHVYAGNRPGQIPGGEDTTCPGCGATLVAREGFRVRRCEIVDGRCPHCRTAVAGHWETGAADRA